jgi:hypothetical protein
MKRLEFACWVLGIALGAVIVGFEYVPALWSCGNECLYVASRHAFYFDQILLTAAGLVLAALLWHRTTAWYVLVGAFGWAIVITWVQGFHWLHHWWSTLDLYPIWLKTSEDGKNVVSFQYARVYVLVMISGGFYASMFKKSFRSFDRVIWAWGFVALCVFMFCMHRVVGRVAFIDYQQHLTQKMERILSSEKSMMLWACEKEGLQCLVLKQGQVFKDARPTQKNQLREISSKEAIEEAVNRHVVEEVCKKNKTVLISENELKQNNIIRSVSFGGKCERGEVSVLIDYHQTAKALDIYLLLFSALLGVFAIIWGLGGWKLRQFHHARGLL